jgi:PadR family transcriptional regulator PadR
VTRRPSRQTAAVLLALAQRPATWRHGYELGQEVGLKAGSVYPILIRLSDRGLLQATWRRSLRPAGHRAPSRLTGARVTFAADPAAESTVDVAARKGRATQRPEIATDPPVASLALRRRATGVTAVST